MVRELDHLDEAPLLVRPGDDQSGVDETRAKMVVDLVAVAVALVDDGIAVRRTRARALGEVDGLRPEPHRPAEILDLLLLRQKVDDRIGRLGIHLRRVRAGQPGHVPRKLGDRDVHAEADPEVGNPELARDAARRDLAFPAARAEAAGNEDSVRPLEVA
jgi:hypothetical protein